MGSTRLSWTTTLAAAGLTYLVLTAATPGSPPQANPHAPQRSGPAISAPSPDQQPPPPTALGTPIDPVAAGDTVCRAAQMVVPDVDVGVEVFDRHTGTMAASHHADQQFPSASLVKLLIALDTLHQANGTLPDAATEQQLHQMLAASDDPIADNLWTADGGPALVTRTAKRLELTGTQPPDDPDEWGDTLTTPQDLVTVYRHITDHLPAADRTLIVDALSNAPEIAADGTDQYFGIPHAMPHTTWAVKQGWGDSQDRAVMGSTGLIGPDSRYIAVLLTSAPAAAYDALPQALTAATNTLPGILNTG